GVWQERRHLDLFELLAQPHARVVFIGPVRLVKSHPEAEWLVLRPRFEELAKIAGVVLRTDARRRHGLTQLVKAWPGWIARALRRRSEVARPPALAREPDEVPRLLQQIGIDLEA